jgi:ribosomal protein S18 acetylase RimI-like enzyme
VDDITLSPLALEQVDGLRDLWIALHHTHRSVSPVPLVEDDELSWQRRRALYVGWLDRAAGFGVLASLDGVPVGYAFCCLVAGPDDTFPVGDTYGDVYSLSVAEGVRGRGIGSRLLDEVDRELDARGIRDLKISVLAGNERAQRLYERRGFRVAELALYRFGSP